MALDSVPPYPCDLGSSSRAAASRTQQRIRKDERTWTSDTYAPYDDGHQWRKYGEKKLSISNFPRFYYRCTYKNDMKCPATKQVQQKDTSDPPLFSVTYFNHHTCSTSSSAVGSARDIASQSSSKKAVSICFSPHAASEQPSFLTSPATPRSPIMHSYSANQQPDRSAYTYQQLQWTGGVPSHGSNGPAKMEVDDSAQPSPSSSSTSALSRTLLPIGQSRCIEYFHFL
ncbi:unnamed protein product [Miscanthus lutarioriparius]|uniref:WRKY domain-containing protein n=1 Tax=Miscanthus lutarioriparius TaxID=422564 RepID=A0A811QA60_9POAL|nr:unnamed protein product [Miscanthus lutarioriparius]